jgi:hypothetical protein
VMAENAANTTISTSSVGDRFVSRSIVRRL